MTKQMFWLLSELLVLLAPLELSLPLAVSVLSEPSEPWVFWVFSAVWAL
ncbi:MAG: hypothetical protein HFH05_13380 [Lachnospiraceae bacterium]|nr:hypothetical protein [Lachnospiraceae bacterium]